MTNPVHELARLKSSLDRLRDVFAAMAVLGFIVAVTCFAEIALYLRGMA